MTIEEIDAETTDWNSLVRRLRGESPKDRLPFIKQWSSFDVPDNFDPDEISWVTDRLGITDLTGSFEASSDGHYVINTAGEIESPADLKQVVEPAGGPVEVRKTLSLIAEVIHGRLENSDQKVVVHCFMGMERSVLSVVWYLHTYCDLSIDEAYNVVGTARPIAVDHRNWALG